MTVIQPYIPARLQVPASNVPLPCPDIPAFSALLDPVGRKADPDQNASAFGADGLFGRQHPLCVFGKENVETLAAAEQTPPDPNIVAGSDSGGQPQQLSLALPMAGLGPDHTEPVTPVGTAAALSTEPLNASSPLFSSSVPHAPLWTSPDESASGIPSVYRRSRAFPPPAPSKAPSPIKLTVGGEGAIHIAVRMPAEDMANLRRRLQDVAAEYGVEIADLHINGSAGTPNFTAMTGGKYGAGAR